MLPRLKCPVIALEEHYWDKELAAQFVGGEGVRDAEMLKRLYDLGEVRIKEMDEAGIDMQILSHGAPSAQKLSGADAVDLTRRVNDRLHAVVTGNPKRFAAFAALPTSDPKAAADELERTTKLGFKGAMIHGLANGVFLDDKRFWPIYERAQALDIPIYLHPSVPLPVVMDDEVAHTGVPPSPLYQVPKKLAAPKAASTRNMGSATSQAIAPCSVASSARRNPAMEEVTQPPTTNEKKAPATLNTSPQKLRSCRLTIFLPT